MKTTRNFLVAVMGTFALCSCATLITGSEATVTIDGDVKEPVDITTTYQTYKFVTLPHDVKVKRKHLKGQRINITSDSHQYKDIVLDKQVNPWTFGNVLLGGIIGWSIDLITNGVSKPAQKVYYVQPLQKESEE